MKKIISIMLIIILLMLQVSAVFAEEEEYYIQVGAFQSKYNAEKHTNYMIGIGYDAVTIKVFDLYKVFLGPYDTEERAREILESYDSVGGSGFFIAGSEMYYKTELPKEEVTEVVEEIIEETVEEAVEETAEESSDDETAVVEETTEETTEETAEETTDGVNVTDEDLEISIIEQEEPVKENDYKLFTIILIVVLWVLFIIIVVIFRLNQNKSKVE